MCSLKIRPTAGRQKGFTLVELIVSVGLFAFVITVSVGALLVLIGANQREQASQSIMTNLSFALDSMTREIRTGYGYTCATFENNSSDFQLNNAFADQDAVPPPSNDCAMGAPGGSEKNSAISFVEAGSSITGSGSRIAYIIELDNHGTIFRRVGNSTELERIVSSGVRIINGEFTLTDSDSLSAGDNKQPVVTIYLEAQDATGATDEIFRVQTTIIQRELDL